MFALVALLAPQLCSKLLASLPEAVLELDCRGKVLFANDRTYAVLLQDQVCA